MLPTSPTIPSADTSLDPDALQDLFQQLVAEHGSLVRAGDLLARMTNDYAGTCRLMLDADIGDLPVLDGFDAIVSDAVRGQAMEDPAAQAQTAMALHWLALQSKESRTLEALVARNAVVANEVADAQQRLQGGNTSARTVFEHTLKVRAFVAKVTQIVMEQEGMRAYVRTHTGGGHADRANLSADTFIRLCQAANTRLERMRDWFGDDWLHNVPFAIGTVEEIAMRRTGYKDAEHSTTSGPGRVPVPASMSAPEIAEARNLRVPRTPDNASLDSRSAHQSTIGRASISRQRRPMT